LKDCTPEFYGDAPVTNVYAKVRLNRNGSQEKPNKFFNISIKMPTKTLKQLDELKTELKKHAGLTR